MGHLTSLGTSRRLANSKGPVDERRDLGWSDGMGRRAFIMRLVNCQGPVMTELPLFAIDFGR